MGAGRYGSAVTDPRPPEPGPPTSATEADLADLADLTAATARLLASADSLDDDAVRAPSLLPGWTRGHVLSHLARNADGMARTARGVLAGVPAPMYDSAEAREAAIEQGAGRPAAEIADDVRRSAEGLAPVLAELAGAGEEVLGSLVLFGPPQPDRVPDQPARSLLFGRLREVEVHHVDLGLPSYRPTDWPAAFVERTLLWVHARTGPIDVVGEPAEVLAWRIGRGAGPSVRRLDGSGPGDPPAGW